jgi:hypothetical protein
LASRTASPGATAVKTAGTHARSRPADSQTLADALSVLETLRRDKILEAVASELLRQNLQLAAV